MATTSPGLPAYKIARLGMAHVVEGRGVFSSLTVEENLTLAFRQRAGRQLLASNLERAYTAFPILGERRRQMAGTLSGGQQRLLSLAKVLVVPPKVLVADELSLGLAPVVVDTVYDGLDARSIGTGTALIVVEQQVSRVLRAGRQGGGARPGLGRLRRRSRRGGRSGRGACWPGARGAATAVGQHEAIEPSRAAPGRPRSARDWCGLGLRLAARMGWILRVTTHHSTTKVSPGMRSGAAHDEDPQDVEAGLEGEDADGDQVDDVEVAVGDPEYLDLELAVSRWRS